MGTEGGRRTDGARRARMEENRRMILAGEIGATRTRLAAFETQGNKLQQVVEKIYMSQEQSGLPEIISDFIRTEGIPVQSACFGVAGLYWDGFRHHPFACEGGHADFAPRNELEMELLGYLQKKYGRISCERILSGPGIKNIYDFLRDTKKEDEPQWLREQISGAPD